MKFILKIINIGTSIFLITLALTIFGFPIFANGFISITGLITVITMAFFELSLWRL